MNTLVRRGPPGRFCVLLAAAALASPAHAQAPVVPDDVNSREISIYASIPLGAVDADDVNSREISIFATEPLTAIAPDDVNSREISVFIPPPGLPVAAEDSFTREYSIYIQPYSVTEVALALRIAAGLHAATQGEVSRLDSEAGSGPHRVELVDALGIMQRALGLKP